MERASEAFSHWYKRDGSPVYTIVGRNGKERNTTLADARKHGFAPSVTGIIKMAYEERLEHYKQEQLLYHSLLTEKDENETDDFHMARIWSASREHSRQAAETGTAIHMAIEQHFARGGYDPALEEYVRGAVDLLGDRFPGVEWITEKSFCSVYGYGGKTDLHTRTRQGLVLDIKGREMSTAQADSLATYHSHWMQLAAYREGLNMPGARCGIVYVSRNVPGLARVVMVPEEKLEQGWEMFQALLAYWKAKNQFVWYPTPEEA